MSYKTFHKGKYYVTFKRGFEDCKKDITIIIDQVFESDCLRISMSDENDSTFLCIVNISRSDYEDLKKQQGLLIDFENFPSQLVRLLQQCSTNNMFIIVQQNNPVQYYLEIVEHNEFKRLVHLSLKTAPATDSDIKQHMADTIENLKKTLAAIKNTAASNEMIWNEKYINVEKKLIDVTYKISKLEDERAKREIEIQEILKHEQDKINQEKLQWQKNLDTATKNQHVTNIENLNRKEKQMEEINMHSKQLQERIVQLEKKLSEKSQRIELLEKEVQKSHIDVATLNAKNSNLDKELTEKDKLFKQINTRCNFFEKSMKEHLDTIKDLNNSLQTARKEKSNLEERLGYSESLANRNNEAARSTSEQLLKANQIITKQNSELIETKEKLLCRTAIALEQEKVIESNNKEIEEIKKEVQETKQNMDKLQSEFNVLKDKYEVNEKMLKDRDETIANNNMVIQWLHKKMEHNILANDDLQPGVQVTNHSPYFIPKTSKTNTSQQLSDESINFYVTSKLSDVEDSPSPAVGQGLDPKYLKPATFDNSKKRNLSKSGFNSAKQKGKENQVVDLPTVNYKEKKTGKTTYRATPVSAYFPR